ncbi:MAG: hypothetical protein E6038_03490 [Clostridium perfringens]|nr:hypothetical protein [Clostridium perfringens]
MELVRLEVQCDYETPSHAGAEGTFQVIEVLGFDEDDNEIDLTNKIDQGVFYYSLEEVAKDLGLPDIEIESV